MADTVASVERLRRRLDPTTRYGMPAHVTVLFPFAAPADVSDEVVGELSGLFAGVDCFDFVLSDVRWFDDRVVYLAPEPADAFRDLTLAVWERFPTYPPYEGAYPDVVPHVCVGEDAPKILMRAAGWLARRRLPLRGRVSEVWLMTIGHPEPRYHLEHVFPLGPDAS
jgi:2'-5' RNA ligase